MERGHVSRTMFIFLPQRLIRPRWLCLAEALVASGRCDTEHVRAHGHVCCFVRRDGCRDKTLQPQSERDKCLSGKVSMSATVCVEREREGELRFFLSLAIASSEKLSFLLSIRRELSLYFSPHHLQRKPQENAPLEFPSRGSDPFLLAQTYRLL